MKNNQTCNNCVFFKTLGHTGTKRECYLFKNNVFSSSPACKQFKINPSNGFRNKRGYL